MTNYRSLVGQKIKKVSSNPSDALDGQVWYNTTEKKLKGLPQLQAWSSTGPLNTARGFGSSAGTYTAGLYFAGTPTQNNSTYSNNTESYDGSSWTEVNDLNTARFAGGGVGATNTAALMYGGIGPPGGNEDATETLMEVGPKLMI